jgi:hypothetical protein
MKFKRAEDMAKKLGIEKETLLGWRDMGMPWVKIGKSIFIFEDSFMEWARDHEIKTNSKDEGKDERDRSKQASLSLVSKI